MIILLFSLLGASVGMNLILIYAFMRVEVDFNRLYERYKHLSETHLDSKIEKAKQDYLFNEGFLE